MDRFCSNKNQFEEKSMLNILAKIDFAFSKLFQCYGGNMEKCIQGLQKIKNKIENEQKSKFCFSQFLSKDFPFKMLFE